MLAMIETRALPLGNDFTLTAATGQTIDVTPCAITIAKPLRMDFLNDNLRVGHVEWQFMKAYFGNDEVNEYDAYLST